MEGDSARLAEGMYDKMGPLGAHEVVVETPDHEKQMSQFSDDELERVLWVWAARIADLKKDPRFKYVSVFKNRGVLAGEEWPHAHSEVAATIFVPRRIKYELHAAHDWFKDKERCIFCDVVRQEEKQGKRIVDVQGDYYALCPYASRVPYEVWVVHRRHNHLFEQPRPGSNRKQLAALLGRVLRRLEKVAPAYHWWCTLRRTPRARRANWRVTGKLWRRTITGTSKSCRSWRRGASLTASKRFILTRSCPSRRPRICVVWTRIHKVVFRRKQSS